MTPSRYDVGLPLRFVGAAKTYGDVAALKPDRPRCPGPANS